MEVAVIFKEILIFYRSVKCAVMELCLYAFFFSSDCCKLFLCTLQCVKY